jgi:hypothetical protein
MKRLFLYVVITAIGVFTFQSIDAQEVKDPIKEAARKLEKQIKEDNYKELKSASAELLALSKDIHEEVEKSGEYVMSARIFDRIEKIEKLTRKIKDKARGPYGLRN